MTSRCTDIEPGGDLSHEALAVRYSCANERNDAGSGALRLRGCRSRHSGVESSAAIQDLAARGEAQEDWIRHGVQNQEELRHFLGIVGSAFDLNEADIARLRPDDEILHLYRLQYPYSWQPDELELETLSWMLEETYAFELYEVWSERLTLGELWDQIRILEAGS